MRPWLLPLVLCGCAAAAKPPQIAAGGELALFAEGPCSKLAIEAVGERRFLVYGDTGYELQAWMPGEILPAAQAVAEVRAGRAHGNPLWMAGLPRDARGYVPAEIELGGSLDGGAWLLLIETRYSRGGVGSLFDAHARGHLLGARGWSPSDEPVALPLASRGLPELPADLCPPRAGPPRAGPPRAGPSESGPSESGPPLSFVPLSWTASPEGGVLVAGRCDDPGPVNLPDPVLVVAHGAAGARSWQVRAVPETDALDGIVNLDLYARADDDAYLVAYEPFAKREERSAYLARFDGASWRELVNPIHDGLMSVTGSSDGTLYLAGGRALHRLDPGGEHQAMTLPPLRHTALPATELHIHTVRMFGEGELWVEAGYRVSVRSDEGRVRALRASALYTTRAPAAELFCDAREPAAEALYEVAP